MAKLFGVPVGSLTVTLLVVLLVAMAVGAFMAWRNPVLFKLGVRNIFRRPAQTTLIVLGLMLAAMLFSAALSTGDTLTHSIRSMFLTRIGNVDIIVRGEVLDPSGRPFYFDQAEMDRLRQALEGDDRVEGIVPFIHEQAPVVASGSRLSEPRVEILGIVDGANRGFNPLLDASGKQLLVDRLLPGEVYLSAKAADKLGVGVGDDLLLFAAQKPLPVKVAGIYASGGVPADEVSLTMRFTALQALSSRAGQVTAILITLKGDAISGAAHSDAVVEKLEPLLEGTQLTAYPIKQDTLKQADEAGGSFASIFLIFGQFSVVAGILLIFLIFVMLAAERKRELGIARAIGAQQSHVVRIFVFEGVAYSAIASAVGAGLGVVVGWGMVRIMAVALGQSEFTLVHDFRPTSLLLAYLLGMVLTVVVVLLAAWRVSRINIVRAVRDIPEPRADRRTLRGFLFTIALLALGLLMAFLGASGEQAGAYYLGTSLFLISVPLLARRFGLGDRPAYTIAGALVLFWWFLPVSWYETLFPFLPSTRAMNSGIEMFFLSGIMMVAGAVWVVMYNSDLLLTGTVLVLGRIRGMPAILKTAVSYPMANRFRTGMALAMFSLVVFTLVVMAFILHASASVFNDTTRLSGGYDIRAMVSYINPIGDIKAALFQSDTVKAADFQAIGSFSGVRAKVKQADTAQEYADFIIQGVDKSYSDSVTYGMEMMADDYATAEEVWKALQSQPNLAVVSPMLAPTRNNYNFGGPGTDLKLEGFYLEDRVLPEVYLQVQDPLTGAEQRLRVIGVVSQIAFYAGGIVTSQDSLVAMAGQPVPPTTYFLKVAPGVDAAATAKALKVRFLENGMQTEVLDEEIRKSAQTNLMFNNLLQGFMGLGLVVGIAALGVIAARSVVERRQQIGVVRAIGFQRGMVQASFLLESSFISLLGIGLGIALAVGLSVQIIDQMKEFFPGIRYTVPVWNIVIVGVIAYGASLLTTFLPARQAANVYPAEALRYE